MNIYVVEERFEKPIPAAIPTGLQSLRAEECKNCHREIYLEWSQSMHAKAWIEPYFQSDFAYDGSQQICLNCHTPLVDQQENLVLGFKDRGKFHPILERNPDYDPLLRNEGVTCAVCHVRDGKIVGPYATENAPHPVTVDPEMTAGMKPCERCHVVSGKRWDTFYAMPPCGTVVEIEKGGKNPDCVGCHMPAVKRQAAEGSIKRAGRMHLFRGGHFPDQVKKALRVKYQKMTDNRYRFTLANAGAAHYLPTGTPDRHLTLELRLVDAKGNVLKEKTYTMKRYVLWRPFIVDLWDTRLPYEEPREYDFVLPVRRERPAAAIDVTVRYHLLNEARRRKIGYNNVEPIAYSIYHETIILDPSGGGIQKP
jgi:hypothetical protein